MNQLSSSKVGLIKSNQRLYCCSLVMNDAICMRAKSRWQKDSSLFVLALLAFIQSWLIYKEHVQTVIVEQNQCFVVIKSPRQWNPTLVLASLIFTYHFSLLLNKQKVTKQKKSVLETQLTSAY
ncbi:hypothetical protein T4B_4441 [Trichinella pseudospiralis]|uniref:Uncharacterized protein n=1 Tax=Trichinella pseudospiralis TaxID=6337 RepID=A0A0V1ID46_TRIPS|nr:hypothetical protein T4A_3988 [Trichinella pseudospiralis]KRZ20388.1 hypothetical protein T4B_4441 [Trichinella pseudospiralis]